MNKDLLQQMKWFSQNALRIEYAGKIIYIDPYRIDQSYHDADYILITHPHQDHTSKEDIDKVVTDSTTFIVPMSASDITDQYPQNGVAEVVPFDVLDLDGFLLEAVPAYNIRKIQCHPKENEWVGYLLTFGDTVLYDTSDTELIPEMNDIKADIIALPLGQKFTMDSVEDAAKAVVTVGASVAIPVHYGVFEGKEEDVAEFEKLLNGKAEVVRL